MSIQITKSTDIKAVIFDIDGTLVDNLAFHEKAWLQFCRKRGIVLTAKEFRKRLFGKNNQEILEMVFCRRLTKDQIKRYADEKEALYRKFYASRIRPLKGFKRLMNRAKQCGLKVAVASCAPIRNREFVFHHLCLDGKFDAVIGDEDIRRGKPDPEIYLKAAKKLGVSRKRCLVFEDSPAGVESARKAGMKVIGVLTGYSRNALKRAAATIKNFDEIKMA